ncbi:MAG: type II toxin-antitoxin system RelE/ParE family toxin [Proteobacteria bacterium]|nr:type II toxin-antitoxin system RelE/ParE family toxin [Pseudomonadota bacterium]
MQIQWTKGASKNLKQVEEYIAQDNPRAAVETVLKIIKSVELLVPQPAIGRVGRMIDTRELVVSGTPYIVPYRVKEGKVQILRVLHGAMEWPKG